MMEISVKNAGNKKNVHFARIFDSLNVRNENNFNKPIVEPIARCYLDKARPTASFHRWGVRRTDRASNLHKKTPLI